MKFGGGPMEGKNNFGSEEYTESLLDACFNIEGKFFDDFSFTERTADSSCQCHSNIEKGMDLNIFLPSA